MTVMVVNELPLSWPEILRLQGHVTLYKKNQAIDSAIQCYVNVVRAQSSVYCRKLTLKCQVHGVKSICSNFGFSNKFVRCNFIQHVWCTKYVRLCTYIHIYNVQQNQRRG